MAFFAIPVLTRSLQRSLLSSLPSLGGSKVPFRKAFRSFRHSRVTPGGWLLMLDTARLHSMTQSHSAVFSFLKLWEKTFFPLPSSHFEHTQRNNMNCKMFFLTLSFATDESNGWAKKCQQDGDEGWWFQGRSEVFRQNFPVGPGCFYHVYRNSQASLRLSSLAPSVPSSQPHCFTHSAFSHQPRFHRPYCLALNSLTSFNPEFTKLLKLYVSEQTRKKGFAANTSLSLISSEQCSLPAECPSII